MSDSGLEFLGSVHEAVLVMHRLHGDLPVPLELAAAVALRWHNGLDGVVSS